MAGSADLPQVDLGALAPGSRLGQYEIVRFLGAGGMGSVYEATHTTIGKRVAAKVLSPAIANIPGAQQRFLREAQLTSRVRHPNIVDVTDMGSDGRHTYLVMELLRGEDLAQRVAREGQMPPIDLVDIMLPVCSAMVAAHEAGITHRDLKPSNVFLSESQQGVQPKVLDFGISKGEDISFGPATLTGNGAVVGTPFYLSPEQIMDNRSAGPGSDQYALGVILYECLTGSRPFQGDNLYATFQAIVAGSAMPPTALRPDLPPALEEIVMRAMHVDPGSRFGSARELGRALCQFASPRSRVLWEDGFGSPADDFVITGGTPPPRTMAKTQILTPSGPTPRGATPFGATPPAVTPAGAAAGAHVGRAGGTRILTPVPPRVLQQMRPGTPASFDVPTLRPRTSRTGLIVGGLVGAAALAVGAWFLLLRPASLPDSPQTHTGPTTARPRRPSPVDPTNPSAVPTETTSTTDQTTTAPPPPAETFKVALSVDPESALIELDGKVAGRGYLRRTLPMDHERHRVRVTADGYEPALFDFTDAPPAEERIELRPHVADGPRAAKDSGKGSARRHPTRKLRDPDSDRPRPLKASAAAGPRPSKGGGGPTLNPNGAPIID